MQRPPASTSESTPSSPGLPPSPVVLADRYRIEREIGRGGMAVVSLAYDLKHERQVAVKFIGEQLGTAVGTQRFLQEIKLTASLQHPHVLSVYDSGVTSDNVLFYVMPYVEGGSLRSTLRERGALPLREVIRITREVADALAFAHQRGIVHRDIKPENILFADGHALVADFGIARLLTPEPGAQHTVTGVVMGTPAYMSPEQAYGLPVDARSDVYSLACVVWEMLTGRQPPTFAGVGWPPKAGADRSHVPAAIETELIRALSPDAAQRHAGTREFADALDGIAPSLSRSVAAPAAARRSWRAGLVAGFGLAIAALAGSAFFSSPLRDRLVLLGIIQLDSMRVLVTPFQSPHSALATVASAAEEALRSELDAWEGLQTISAQASRDAIGDTHDATLERSIRAARQVRAGLLLRSLVHSEAGTVIVETHAIDARSGTVVATIGLPAPETPDAWSVWAVRGASLLLAGIDSDTALARAAGSTRSLLAWRAYARGQQALARWDLGAAESAFAAAVAADARFTAARVWLAQTAFWTRRSSNRSEWRRHAEEITTTGLTLDATEMNVAVALSALGRREEPQACGIYRAMLRRDSLDARAWLGLGDCQALDDGVVRNARSPSGYVFRASWNGAVRAYERAVRLSPGAHAALPAGFIERLLPAQVRFRPGVGADDTSRIYVALPTALGDTVGYFPHPFVAGGLPDPPRIEEALRRNGARLLAYVTAWTERAPGSVDAYEALAGVQETRGELTDVGPGGRLSAAAALDSARRLSTQTATSMRLAASQVRILVKAAEFERARSLADSLMRRSATASAQEAHWLAGIAALTGRVRDAARLARIGRTPPVDWDTLQAPLASGATLLLAQAAAGVCDDGFRSAPQRVDALIDSYTVPSHRAATRALLMSRPRRLAVPCLGIAQIATLEARSPWDRMQAALGRADTAAVKAVFDSMMAARRDRRPGGTAADYIHIGAWTLLAAGDTARAERYADQTLNALPTLSRNAVWELTQAAALGRLFAWRADLANVRADRQNATRWATAVAALWKHADAELQPVVERMRAIAESR